MDLRTLVRVATLTTIGFMCCSLGGKSSISNDSLAKQQIDEAKRVLAAAFRPLKLVPILIAEQQRPGDVYLFGTWTLDSRRDECFRGLPADGPFDTKLMDNVEIRNISAGAAARIDKLISFTGDTGLEDSVEMRFFEEKSYVLSRNALRSALLPSCGVLAKIINEDNIDVSSPNDLKTKVRLLAIIGRTVYAKRRIFIGEKSHADIAAAADGLKKLLGTTGLGVSLQVLPADISVSLSLGFGARRGVIIEDQSALPIAFSPAYIPEVILSTELGGTPVPKSVAWKPFDEGVPSDVKLFNEWYDRAIRH